LALWDKFTGSGDSDAKRAAELWARANKYFEGKLYNRALKDLSDALTLQPGYATEALELMQVFSMQGNDEQALSVGLALLKVDNKNAELMNKLGNTLRKLGSFAKAKKLHTMALKIDPKMRNAKYNLAACSFKIATADGELLRVAKAAEQLTEPHRYEFMGERIDFHPIPNQQLDAEGKLVEPEEEEEEMDEGEEGVEKPEVDEEEQAQLVALQAKQLQEDISASQGGWQEEFNLGLFYDLMDMPDMAIEHLQKAMVAAPEEPAPLNNLAVVYMHHKEDYAKAEGMLLEGLTKFTYDRPIILNLAVLYRKLNKGFQTLKYYVYLGDLLSKSLYEFDTEHVEEHAKDLFQRRKYVEAIPVFQHLAKELRETFWYEKLSVMYFNQKREAEYIRALKDLLELDPENEDAKQRVQAAAQDYEDKAKNASTQGNKRQALGLLEKAVKIEETASRLVELAQLYEDEGEEILAQNTIKRWKKMSGQFDSPPPEDGAGEDAGDESSRA